MARPKDVRQPYPADMVAPLVGLASHPTQRALTETDLTANQIDQGVAGATKAVRSARRRSNGGTGVALVGLGTTAALHVLAPPVAFAVDAFVIIPSVIVAAKGAYDRGILRRRGLTPDTLARAKPEAVARAYHTMSNVPRAEGILTEATRIELGYSTAETGSVAVAQQTVWASDSAETKLRRTRDEVSEREKRYLLEEIRQRPQRQEALAAEQAGMQVARSRQSDAGEVVGIVRQLDKGLRKRVKKNRKLGLTNLLS